MNNEHEDHGKGHEGPDDSDCVCRGTKKEAECAKEFCGFCVVAQMKNLDETARFAAKYVMEGSAVTLSKEGIRAMAEFIHGPHFKVQGPETGSCPICGGLPGKCLKNIHGFITVKNESNG